MSTRMEHGDLVAFWGKTPRGDGGVSGEILYKPVVHHLLDVAAVALQWQFLHRPRLVREADLIGCLPDDLARMNAFLVGLHDVGKISRGFQSKVEYLWPDRVLGPLSRKRWGGDRVHWRSTALLLRDDGIETELSRLLPSLTSDHLSQIIAAVAGHHGCPPDFEETNARKNAARRSKGIGIECVRVAHAAVTLIRDIVSCTPLNEMDSYVSASRWSWRLSGLTTFADWVGSALSFRDCSMPFDAYWESVQREARGELLRRGLGRYQPVERLTYNDFTDHGGMPRPVQQWAASDLVPIVDGPQLFIIEDTTGSGKTEAAFMLSWRLIDAGKGEGLYLALPTMATTNAMYGRLLTIYQRLFVESDRSNVSLVLAHGKSKQSDHFLAIVRSSDRENGVGGSKEENEESVEAMCNEWLADDRRKGFLAPVAAGTIDQVFLTVLPKKHLTLRQYGLAGRILIVDEAHCFDSYMMEEMTELLKFLASQGVSVIVLSATLSMGKRQEMVNAFSVGLGCGDPDVQDTVQDTAYPLVTSVSRDGVAEYRAGFDTKLGRRVPVERLSSRDAAQVEALSAAAQGASVLVFCNAVDEAINTYEAYKMDMEDPSRIHLFHARFTQGDRQSIEQDVLDRFGRDGGAADRAGHILVATQVAEQSLDLDFDLVISDLAPVDMLIQRAGRLWRHLDKRPACSRPIAGPRMLVVSPDPDTVPDAGWLRPVLKGGANVYDHAGVMWRSAKVIFDTGFIDTPHGLRTLIERVYGREDVPEVLEKKQNEDDGKEGGKRAIGQFNVIDGEDGYISVRANGGLSEDIGTRLGAATCTVRLACRRGGVLVPWPGVFDGDIGRAWAESEVRVRKGFFKRADVLEMDRGLRDQAMRDWPDWEKQQIKLMEVDDGVNGRLKLFGLKDGQYFTYSNTMGLRSVDA